MSIDWATNRIAFNRDHHTKYKTRYMLLRELYKVHKSTAKMGEILCISQGSICNGIKAENARPGKRAKIIMLPKGHRYPTPTMLKIINMDTRNRTLKQIKTEVGICQQYTWMLLKRFKKKWQRRDQKEAS